MPSAAKYCHFKPKGTSNTKLVKGKAVTTLSKSRRCKRTDDQKEDSPMECEVDRLSGNCGVRDQSGRLSRSREHGRHYHTSHVHKLGKLHVPSRCVNDYRTSGKCAPDCKLVNSYTNKKGKVVKASCRAPRVKSQ
jgi:hypothetical protein